MSRNRIYVGRLAPTVTEGDLNDLFGKYGQVSRVDFKGSFAFVEFKDDQEAQDAIRKLDRYELKGDRLRVENTRSRDGGRDDDRRERRPLRRNEHCQITVEDLPSHISWQTLKDHFSAEVSVLFCDVERDRGYTKGIVEFDRDEDLDRAMRRLDGSTLNGERLRLRNTSLRSSRRYSPYSRRRSPSPRRRSPSPRRDRGYDDRRYRDERDDRRRDDRDDRRRDDRRRSPSPRRRSPSPRREERRDDRDERAAPAASSSSGSSRRSPSPRRHSPSPRRDERRSPSPSTRD